MTVQENKTLFRQAVQFTTDQRIRERLSAIKWTIELENKR